MDVTENKVLSSSTQTSGVTAAPAPTPVSAPAPTGEQQQQVDLLKLAVSNENQALNGLVAFLNVAQRRGVFTIPEASKINECIQMFVREAPPSQ
tara:strand:- start:38 stop:319 length:282 start_codon:yes stop_codon:yes gene_type:complete